uniref:C2 calcium dependent domain containing 2 n=1 Tax=Leptobrachium leishanense TaxID=445787 RepID=A0A8C5LXH1_9ANUR
MSWFGEAQWFFLLSMFVTALVTLGLYLFQDVLGSFWSQGERSSLPSAHGEANSLLSWILSLPSWKNQWLKAWINALNEEAGKRGFLGASAIVETLEDILKNLMGVVRPSVELCTQPTDARDAQHFAGGRANSHITCPPKPPRVHELKLQVKNIRAALSNGAGLSGTSVVFAGPPLAWASVPLDLFRKQPSGWQSFPLSSQSASAAAGSVTAQFLYIEPNEVKCRPIPSPLPAKKVEKDRTVMPCGTVVTTVTSVSSKPRVEGRGAAISHDSPRASPNMKVIERDFSVQAISSQSVVVSKALSSSDTELLMLNGSDPVAEAAIKQLRESSKQPLKSPRKKSTIIISGVSKTTLSQDDESTLMFNYAAAMDSTTADDLHSISITDATEAPGNSKVPQLVLHLPPATSTEDELHSAWENGSQTEEWTSNGLAEQDCEEMSVSNMSISETGSVKKSKGGFLKKGAKLFFRRKHQQKDPGMSQSHNDLVYLQEPGTEEHRKKGATLSRLLGKKLAKNRHNLKNCTYSRTPEPGPGSNL